MPILHSICLAVEFLFIVVELTISGRSTGHFHQDEFFLVIEVQRQLFAADFETALVHKYVAGIYANIFLVANFEAIGFNLNRLLLIAG